MRNNGKKWMKMDEKYVNKWWKNGQFQVLTQTYDQIQGILCETFRTGITYKVKLGDDYQYPIKGSGKSSYKLDSGNSMTMNEVLFVPRLKKNLLSISTLDAK